MRKVSQSRDFFLIQRITLGTETPYIRCTPRKLDLSLYARKISSLRAVS